MPAKPKNAMFELVERAREKQAARANVVELSELRPETRVDRGVDKHGPYCRVVFPVAGSEPEEYDLSYLCDFPNLCEPLAEAFKRWGTDSRGTTRNNVRKVLRRSFIEFLAEQKTFDIEIQSINRDLWMAFKGWLDKPRNGSSNPWHPDIRRQYLGNTITLFEALATVPEWSGEARRIVTEAPRGAYPGSSRKNIPRDSLEWSDLLKIKAAAEAEVRAIVARLDEGERMIAEGREKLAQGSTDFFKDLSVSLAAIDARYPHVVPSEDLLKRDLRAEGPVGAKLFNAVKRRKFLTYTSLRGALSRDLVPFVLLISIATGLNAEQVLALEMKDYELIDDMGGRLIVINAFKDRSASFQKIRVPAGDLNRMGLGYIFEHIKRATERARRGVAAEYRDRLLVFRPERGTSAEPVGFGTSRQGASADSVWKRGLDRFISDNGLRHFTLSQIRPTVGDDIQQRYGAVAAADFLGHKSVDTTRKFYTSAATRRRGQMRIGEVQLLYERWRHTEGKIDPRKNFRDGLDKGAATPGFTCKDPLNSPRPNQKAGQLCQAYGECAACPKALAHPNDHNAAAYYIALRQAIFDAAGTFVAPAAWRTKWAEIALNLEALIDAVPDTVKAKIKPLPYPLPSIR
jgi:integrase